MTLPMSDRLLSRLVCLEIPEVIFQTGDDLPLDEHDISRIMKFLTGCGDHADFLIFRSIVQEMVSTTMHGGDHASMAATEEKINAILVDTGMTVSNGVLVGTPLPKNPLYEGYDSDRKVIRFAGHEILLTKQTGTDATELMKVVADHPDERLERPEILEGMDYGGEDSRSPRLRKKIHSTASKINKTVFKQTGVKDFLDFKTKHCRINRKYLK
jgi:hypothetical protein